MVVGWIVLVCLIVALLIMIIIKKSVSKNVRMGNVLIWTFLWIFMKKGSRGRRIRLFVLAVLSFLWVRIVMFVNAKTASATNPKTNASAEKAGPVNYATKKLNV